MSRRRRVAIVGLPDTYQVVENLHYNHTAGAYGLAVLVGGFEKIVTSHSARGPWRLSSPIAKVHIPDVRGQ